LIRARTREGMAEAKKAGRLKGKQPKLSTLQRKRLLADYESGEYTAAQLCEISGLCRSAMYATLRRAREEAALSRT
ncbi:recombinase family protein, partial [Rhodococcus sp. As11]